MARTNEAEQNLFTEQELSGIQPTGSAWMISNDDPATVPIPLQVVIVDVDGPYNERDRKLWAFLLHAVFDELGEKQMHSLSVREINNVFRELGGDHNTKWLWESAKRLAKTTVEWEYSLGDERFQGISSIFGAIVSKEARRSGTLHFHFPPLLIPIIKQPMRFARLRVHFLLKLSGKYAVTLYEVLEGFANRRDGQCRVSLKELRTWLKVPEKSYSEWKDFRKRVLDPAVKQINDDPLGAGFSVEYTPIRKGRYYDEIVFQLTKTKKRIRTDQSIKRSSENGRSLAVAKASGRPHLSPNQIDLVAQSQNRFLDMEKVVAEFWEYWESRGRPDFVKGVGAAFKGFADKKYRQVKYGRAK